MGTEKYSSEYKKRYVSLMVLTCLASINMNSQVFAEVDSMSNNSNNQNVVSVNTPSGINYNVPTLETYNATYGTGNSTKYYKWQTNDSGNKTFVEAQESDAQIKVNHDSSNPKSRLNNDRNISSSPLVGNFIGNYSSSSYGGAINNYHNSSNISGGITGDFFSKFATFNFFVFPKLYTMKEK